METKVVRGNVYRRVGIALGAVLALGCQGSGDDESAIETAAQALTTTFDAALCGDTSGLEPGAAWPAFGACPTGRRSSPRPGTRDPRVNWTVNLGIATRSSPAIGANGNLYFGDNAGAVLAYDSDGTRLWRAQLLGPVRSSPAIGKDGTIYIASSPGGLFALNPQDGSQRWNFFSAYTMRSSPALGGNGKVYVSGGGQLLPGNALFALDAQTGSLAFKVSLTSPSSSAPAIAPDGTVYVATDGTALRAKTLYAVDPTTGAVRWTANVGGVSTSGPAVAPDGTIYVPSGQRALRAFAPNGSLKWSFQHICAVTEDCSASATPAIGPDGTVYFATLSGKIAAVSPTGQEVWQQSVGGGIEASPAVDSEGWVYVATDQGKLQIRDARFGGEQASVTLQGGAVFSSPAISAFGTVYVATNRLYSIGERYTAFAYGTDRIPIGECNNNRLAAGTTTQVCLVKPASNVGRRDFYVNGHLVTATQNCVSVAVSRYTEVRAFEYSPQGVLVASNAAFLTTNDNPKHCPIHDNVILGGPGDDVLVGTNQSDYISGGPGIDYIVPRGGNDIVVGGDDPDTFDLTGLQVTGLGGLQILEPDLAADKLLANAPSSGVPSSVFSPNASCGAACIEVPRNFERVYDDLSDRHTFDEPSFQEIRQIHDIGGGYIAAGSRRERTTTKLEPLLVKLTPSGAVEWSRTSADFPDLYQMYYTGVEPFYDAKGKRVGYIMSGTGNSKGFIQLVDLLGHQLALNMFDGRFAGESGGMQGSSAAYGLDAIVPMPDRIVAVGYTEGTGKVRFPDGTWREQPGRKGYVVITDATVINGRFGFRGAEAISADLGTSPVGFTQLLSAALIPNQQGTRRIAVGGQAGGTGLGSAFVATVELAQLANRTTGLRSRLIAEPTGSVSIRGVANAPGIGIVVGGATDAFKTGNLKQVGFLKLVDYDLNDLWGPDTEAGPFFSAASGYALLGGYTSSGIISVTPTEDGGYFAAGGSTHPWTEALLTTASDPELVGLLPGNHGLAVKTNRDGLSRKYRGFGHENNDPAGRHVFEVTLGSGKQTSDLGFVAAGIVCPGTENGPGPRSCRPQAYVVKVEPDLTGANAVCSCSNGRVDCGESITGFIDATRQHPGDCGGSSTCAPCAVDCDNFRVDPSETGRDCGGLCSDPFYTPSAQPQRCECETNSDCNDNNDCTVDTCSDTGCSRVPVSGTNVVCNGGSGVCNGSVCQAQCTTCNDNNECTQDSCNPTSGCVFDGDAKAGALCANNTGTCNGNGHCDVRCGGSCDDSNECTTDSCSAATGCSNPNKTNGTACTGGTCQGGVCTPDEPPPPPTFSADVSSILDHYCAGCHTANPPTNTCFGRTCFVGNYAVATQGTSSSACTSRGASTIAQCISARVFDGSMPQGGGCGPGNRPAATCPTDANLATIQAWVAAGAPQ